MNAPAQPDQRRSYHQLWPAILLVSIEALAYILLIQQPGSFPHGATNRISLMVSTLILLSGFLPAVLKPGQETILTACLATLLASVLVNPIYVDEIPRPLPGASLFEGAPAYLVLRLTNGCLIAPLAFHLAARFPRRSQISSHMLVAIYLLTMILTFTLLFSHIPEVRIGMIYILPAWGVSLILGALSLLLLASRATRPDERRTAQQARILFFSLTLAELPALLRLLGLLLQTDWVPPELVLSTQILVPIGIAYAVLRHDLFGIDSVLRRALAYTTLSLMLVAIYLGLTVAMTAIFSGSTSQFKGAATLLSLLIAAITFEPARQHVQQSIDRALYPDRLRFQAELEASHERLTRVVGRQEILQLLTQDLPARLGAEWASISLFPAPEIPGSFKTQPAWNSQLIVAGQSLGRYWLGPRRTEFSYGRDEQARLQALINQAALALAYADTIESLNNLNRELEERVEQRSAQVLSQQRSLAAFEERQRLGRELHDSISQALFSMNLSARALRKLVHQEPQAAINGLVELEAIAQQALAEMRGLLAHLRSPLHDETGDNLADRPLEDYKKQDLSARLMGHCEQLRREAGPDGLPPLLDVQFDGPAELWLPAWLSNELFQIAREGLHNILKHAGTRRASCTLRITSNFLSLTIQDQGRGFDPQQTGNGYGLRGMGERITALGGEFEIVSQTGQGSRLQVQIDLSRFVKL